MNIIDISMEVDEDMITYPGNPSPSFNQYSSIPDDVTNETKLCTGSHTGTHVDAPKHVRNEGGTAANIDLTQCYGPCRVVDIGDDASVDESHVDHIEPRQGEIIIFKTKNTYEDPFNEDYAYISRGAAQRLIEADVKAVGIDYLSVKQFNGDNDVHEDLITNMTVYEGLALDHVDPGTYTFAGFPLKLPLDAGMTRAVLIEE